MSLMYPGEIAAYPGRCELLAFKDLEAAGSWSYRLPTPDGLNFGNFAKIL
jgi:hypothetical protein